MKKWKLTLGAVVVLALGAWDIGIPGVSHAPARSAHQLAHPAASSRLGAAGRPRVPGVLQPQGAPEFSAAFSGSALDTSVWSTCYPSMDVPTGCTNYGNKWDEREWYLPSQDRVYGGALHLVAQMKTTLGEARNGKPENYACRSGMVTTDNSFQFEYGYVQVVARIPNDAGLWSALWLATVNGQDPPEIDILEGYGRGPFSAESTLHYVGPKGTASVHAAIPAAAIEVGWHTYALSWTSSQLTWLVDGKVILTVRAHIPHQKMYFIANLAQNIWPADPVVLPGDCQGSMDVRSVKIWAR
jgi:beta-glucanase (GH16 family)